MLVVLIGFVLAAAVMAGEHALCTRLCSPVWGALLPGLLLAAFACLAAAGQIEPASRAGLALLLIDLIFWGMWYDLRFRSHGKAGAKKK